MKYAFKENDCKILSKRTKEVDEEVFRSAITLNDDLFNAFYIEHCCTPEEESNTLFLHAWVKDDESFLDDEISTDDYIVRIESLTFEQAEEEGLDYNFFVEVLPDFRSIAYGMINEQETPVKTKKLLIEYLDYMIMSDENTFTPEQLEILADTLEKLMLTKDEYETEGRFLTILIEEYQKRNVHWKAFDLRLKLLNLRKKIFMNFPSIYTAFLLNESFESAYRSSYIVEHPLGKGNLLHEYRYYLADLASSETSDTYIKAMFGYIMSLMPELGEEITENDALSAFRIANNFAVYFELLKANKSLLEEQCLNLLKLLLSFTAECKNDDYLIYVLENQINDYLQYISILFKGETPESIMNFWNNDEKVRKLFD